MIKAVILAKIFNINYCVSELYFDLHYSGRATGYMTVTCIHDSLYLKVVIQLKPRKKRIIEVPICMLLGRAFEAGGLTQREAG